MHTTLGEAAGRMALLNGGTPTRKIRCKGGIYSSPWRDSVCERENSLSLWVEAYNTTTVTFELNSSNAAALVGVTGGEANVSQFDWTPTEKQHLNEHLYSQWGITPPSIDSHQRCIDVRCDSQHSTHHTLSRRHTQCGITLLSLLRRSLPEQWEWNCAMQDRQFIRSTQYEKQHVW